MTNKWWRSRWNKASLSQDTRLHVVELETSVITRHLTWEGRERKKRQREWPSSRKRDALVVWIMNASGTKWKKTLIPSTTYQDIHNLQCFGWVILGIKATGMPFPVKKGIILHTMCNFYVNCSWNEISSRNKSTLFSPTNKEKRCEIMYVWYISAKQ